jgi:hypothetical protein
LCCAVFLKKEFVFVVSGTPVYDVSSKQIVAGKLGLGEGDQQCVESEFVEQTRFVGAASAESAKGELGRRQQQQQCSTRGQVQVATESVDLLFFFFAENHVFLD